MRRALANLLDNALKHTPRGGRIQVTRRIDAEGDRLSVDNTGSQLPEGEPSRLFERFITAGDKPGRGLGLAFVAAIAARYGWRAEAQNTADGVRVSLLLGAE